jgi:hypothetical protein
MKLNASSMRGETKQSKLFTGDVQVTSNWRSGGEGLLLECTVYFTLPYRSRDGKVGVRSSKAGVTSVNLIINFGGR